MGLNYHRLLSYAESLGLEYVYYLERLPMGQMAVDCLGPCKVRHISMNELKNDDFFARMAMEMNMQTVVSDPEKQDMMEEF